MELNEVKQTMLKTDNQKMISLATKIEQLNSQLSMANDRCNTLHKKAAKEGDTAKYADELKMKIESLERQLSEKKATTTIEELQGKVPTNDEVSGGLTSIHQWQLFGHQSENKRLPIGAVNKGNISDLSEKERKNGFQIEQMCEVLASIESQTNRLAKQIEKIEQSQKVADLFLFFILTFHSG